MANKRTLVDLLRDDFDVKKCVAEQMIDSILETILQTVYKKNELFQIRGFGTFAVKKFKAREFRNPATGGTMKVGQRQLLKFKPSPTLRITV